MNDFSQYDTTLANLLRPKSIQDFWQSSDSLKKLKAIEAAWINHRYLPNIILWGPPGSGKTTLAKLIGAWAGIRFVEINATSTGTKELKESFDEARSLRRLSQIRTVLFIDEIHRLNKAQQDVLLPATESGDVILLGATTEAVSFELTNALLSRCTVILLSAHDQISLRKLIERACSHFKLSLENTFTEDAIDHLAHSADGDARHLLNSVEMSVYCIPERPISKAALLEMLYLKPVQYDKNKSESSHLKSAFIKSMRGSDPDAALYYLARMISGGEDILFIARRLVIFASEDVGNADPRAMQIASAAAQSTQLVGLPEAGIILAQAATYLACAPKSNRSYAGFNLAMDEVMRSGSLPVPLKFRSGANEFLSHLGYGAGYKYPHDHKIPFVNETYLPEEIRTREFYTPSQIGFEKTISEYLRWLRQEKPTPPSAEA